MTAPARYFQPPAGDIVAAVARALAEDLTPLGDLSAALLPDGAQAEARFVTRAAGVVAGTACATEAFRQVDPSLVVVWERADGARVEPGDVIGTVSGPMAPLLTGERTALNFLGHLSGIATLTARYVAACTGPARVWDTRKTLPGLRSLQKAAVRAGGAANHRGNLSDWVMLKDNHLMGLGIADGVARARELWPGRTIHVECERIDQVEAALVAGAGAIMCDNMTLDEMRASAAAVTRHAATTGVRPLLEASGGITLESIGPISETGVDFISSGQLTNSAPVLDIGLDVSTSRGDSGVDVSTSSGDSGLDVATSRGGGS